MLSIFTDSLPKSVVAGVALWAGVSYFITGPEAGARVARADFLPACEANFKNLAQTMGEQRLRALPEPSFDPMQEHAADTVRRLQNNRFMTQLRMMGGEMTDLFGLDGAAKAALAQMELARTTARHAYDQARARIKEETAGTIAKAGDVCSCVANAAVADTRTEWALFAGSLTLIEPAPIKNFAQTMAQVHGAGGCDAGKTGA